VRIVLATYLVTGCAGFIGWKVSEYLLAAGYEVVGVDNLNDAYDVRLKHWRLAQLGGKPGFEFHRLDICNREALRGLFNPKCPGDRSPSRELRCCLGEHLPALRDIAAQYNGRVRIVRPVHLNPNVSEPVHWLLRDAPNITLTQPLDYLPLVHLTRRSYLVLTDSGGIHEETTILGVPLRQAQGRPA
jgi:hypothetical protein